MLIWIWFIGFTITWIACKVLRNKTDDNTWDDVAVTIILSIFSWIGLGVIVLSYFIIIGIDFFEKEEPPKWL